MALDLMREKGVPLEDQKFDWRDIVRVPTSKLDDDAFTRVRIILMNGIESEVVRFQHACARMNKDLQLALAPVRRVEHHQQTMVNWAIARQTSHHWRQPLVSNRWPLRSRLALHSTNRIRTLPKSIGLAYSKISTTCIGFQH